MPKKTILVLSFLCIVPGFGDASSVPMTDPPPGTLVPSVSPEKPASSSADENAVPERFEPSEGQAYPVWMIRYPDSRVRNVYYTDLSGNGHRTEYVYDAFKRLGEIRQTDTLVPRHGAKASHTVVEGFGFDQNMKYAVLWKSETGRPTLNYNYWYEGEQVASRFFRVKEVHDGPEIGVGKEVLDEQGRVTGRLFKDASGDVTRTSWNFYVDEGRPYVRERTWAHGYPATHPPDEIRIYRIVSGVRLIEKKTVQKFVPGDRTQVTERHTVTFSYSG